MESLIRNVGDIDVRDRQALEHVLGQTLRVNQQLVIHIVTLDVDAGTEPISASNQGTEPQLPDWCNVYEGLSGAEVEDLEGTILARTDLSRTAE